MTMDFEEDTITVMEGWRYKWLLPPQPSKSLFAHLSQYNELVLKVLFRRGITNPWDIESFLSSDDRQPESIGYLMNNFCGMKEATARIRHAIISREPITVYGDFDVDGVTSTSLLVQVLRALGGKVRHYIPNRVDEGYGLNRDSLEALKKDNQRLVITVDCGIRSVSDVVWANHLGLDMIITDHHSVGEHLPPAVAVLNPKQPNCRYQFKNLSGVGVAYKLATVLVEVSRRAEPSKHGQALSLLQDTLDLVALGTISDIVPLVGENRHLVRLGLEQLAKTQRPGLKALMKVADLTPEKIDSTSVSFVLGPRLNAAGRLRDASLSYRLLQANDDKEAESLAHELETINRERRRLTAEHHALAQEELEKVDSEQFIYLVANRNFHPGVVGLVASQLVGQYYRPAVVVEIGESHSRGSARSIPEFNITWALDQCSDLLLRHGGHEAAAGFTVENDKLDALKHRLQALAAEHLQPEKENLRPKLEIDAEVALGNLDFATAGLLSMFQPTGHKNPPPILLSRNVLIQNTRKVGADGAHLKLTVSDPTAGGPRSNVTFDAIAFRQGHWHGRLPARVDMVYALEENVWNGTRRLQLVVEDVRAAS